MNENNSRDVQESSLLLRASRQSEYPLEDALLSALQWTEQNLTEQDPPLHDFFEVEALDQLNWDNPALEVHTSAWGHPIRITPEYIYVYSATPP